LIQGSATKFLSFWDGKIGVGKILENYRIERGVGWRGGAGVVGQQGLLPSHEDPKLWLVELKAGTEREAVICLMQKAIDFAAKGTPLLIKSAFVQDHLRVRVDCLLWQPP
jgi:Early transcription elongation factor of RNA pol II, NGN section